MKRTWISVRTGAVLIAVLASCSDDSQPTSPENPPSAAELQISAPAADVLTSASAEERNTIDYEYARIAVEEVPGFGGYFVDRQGVPQAFLKDRANRGRAVEALGRFLDRVSPRLAAKPDLTRINARVGQYDFAELLGWLEPLQGAVFQIEGVQSTDIDETRNRLVVGVLTPSARAGVLRTLAKLPVPREAVIVEIEAPLRITADSLNGKVRPIKGGLGIRNSVPKYCSLGFIMRQTFSSAAFPYYFVTNSHCTAVQGGVENTDFWQPDYTFFNAYLGQEVADPYYTKSSTTYCPLLLTPSLHFGPCRWSDAAYGSIYSGAQSYSSFGKIARTYPQAQHTHGGSTRQIPRLRLLAKRLTRKSVQL